jgi:hypothetical protein
VVCAWVAGPACSAASTFVRAASARLDRSRVQRSRRAVAASSGSSAAGCWSDCAAPRSRSLRSVPTRSTARAAASAITPVAMPTPSRPPNGISPNAPPKTHAIMSVVSEWAKALARTCSRTRSWTVASTASLARPADAAATRQNRATLNRLKAIVAYRPAAAVSTVAPACSSTGRRMRSRAPTALPRNAPRPRPAATTPSAPAPASENPKIFVGI